LPGLSGAIAFYGQSIARPLPGADKPALDEIEAVRAPLLLVFGGHDELIGSHEIALIRDRLTAAGATFQIQEYPEVGHSFFREDLGTIATRQIADAWDRVVSFLRAAFA
jgi:dienelactone hydrolase